MGLSINNNYDYLNFLKNIQNGQISATDLLRNRNNESFLTLSKDSDSFEFSSSLDEMMDEISAYEKELGINNTEENVEIPEEVMEELQEIIANEIKEVEDEIKADEKGEVAAEEETKSTEEAKKTADDAEKAVKGAEEVSETEAAAAASSVSETTLPDSEEAAKIKEEIDALEKDKDANYEEMEKIEAEIEELTKKAEENIMLAAKGQEAKVAEHEEETQAAVEENINAYVAANKDGGEGMTQEELQENIKSSLSNVPEVGDAVSAAVAANAQIAEIDTKLGELNSLIADTKEIEDEIEAKTAQYDACKEAEKAEAEAKKACDPIGFTMGEGEEQVKYDFIVDDGAFDSTSDFLGAENQWEEMAALDTDGDQIVSAAELEAGNIKMVKTDAEGNQNVVSIAEEFGEEFSINLGSYQEGGSHSAINTTTDADKDGVADQELLGTFAMNVNGQEIQGYNTLDDTEWLQENYGLSAETTATDAEKVDEISYSTELQSHVNFFNTYTQKVEELKEQLKETWANLGQTEASLNALNAKATEETIEQVEETAETGNAAASEEATEITETEETAEVETPTTEEIAEKELKLEEENFFLAA